MRRLSLIVAGGYLLLPLLAFDPNSVGRSLGMILVIAGYLVLPLTCIWFGDEMGDYVGMLPVPGINKSTPGGFVKVGGWILLLLPLVAVWIMMRGVSR